MPDDEKLQVRVYGSSQLPTLIYLPGLHGDWTLVGGFRGALGERLRFVEMTYPRTLKWSLDDYAAAIEQALAEQNITSGWLLGESFGSQVMWALIGRRRFAVRGAILAGGFVRHPVRLLVRLGEKIGGGIPLRWITSVLFGYAKFARLRFRKSPETIAGIQEFIERRTELDRQAAIHRLRLIAGNDPGQTACACSLPLYAMTGFWDPIVPWIVVRGYLKRNCRALRDYKVFRDADHNVLGTAPQQAANQAVAWINRTC